MAYEVASASVGAWRLTLDELSHAETDVSMLELSIEGDDFDISVNVPSVVALESLARSIESSAATADVTAKERCFVGWTVADLFIFAEESRLTFLLLNAASEKERFRISVPVTQKRDFLAALYKLKEDAAAEL